MRFNIAYNRVIRILGEIERKVQCRLMVSPIILLSIRKFIFKSVFDDDTEFRNNLDKFQSDIRSAIYVEIANYFNGSYIPRFYIIKILAPEYEPDEGSMYYAFRNSELYYE